MTLGDRLIVMYDGYAAQIGTPLDVYEHPATKFVAGFIGSPAMNFLNGVISENGVSVEFPGDGKLDLGDNFKDLKSMGDELKDDLTIGPAAAHVPRDDDTYSPLHDKESRPSVAAMNVEEDVEPVENEAQPDDEGDAEEQAKEKPA